MASEVLNKPLSNVEKRLLSRIWQNQRSRFPSDKAAMAAFEEEYWYSGSSFYKYRNFHDEEMANVEPVETAFVHPAETALPDFEKLGKTAFEQSKKIGEAYLKAVADACEPLEIDLPDFAPDAPKSVLSEELINWEYDAFDKQPIELEEIGQFSKKVEGVESLASEDFEGGDDQDFFDPPSIPTLPKRAKMTKTRTELFITDVHLPFHCAASYELCLQVAREMQPDILYLNGDFIDCFSVSQWDKDPKISQANDIQSEFDKAIEKIAELKAILPEADFYYKDGNHEDRFNRYLFKHATALSSLRSLSVRSLLKLDEFGIEHIEQNAKKRIGNLFHLHGHEIKGGGVNVALAKLKKMFSNVIFGHHHVQQSSILRKYDGDAVGAWSIGCLADFNQDYVHHAETWSSGFATVEYLPSGIFHVQPINIISEPAKKICKVEGKWFEQATNQPKAMEANA